MELFNQLRETYGPGEDDRFVEIRTKEILSSDRSVYESTPMLKRYLGLLDLTTLNTQDNDSTARKFARNVNTFSKQYPELQNVAAICVYPSLVEEIKKELSVPGVKIASVGASFPSSQTFLAVKLAECELIVAKGADEIDVVIQVGEFFAGNFQKVLDELILIREVTKNIQLKVILETGILASAENIRAASMIAMEAGADFIKTSTGKTTPAATPEAVYIMAKAIRDFYTVTGRMVGLKPAGGISTVDELIPYILLVDKILGDEWIQPHLFRIGASRLANNLLSKILDHQVVIF